MQHRERSASKVYADRETAAHPAPDAPSRLRPVHRPNRAAVIAPGAAPSPRRHVPTREPARAARSASLSRRLLDSRARPPPACDWPPASRRRAKPRPTPARGVQSPALLLPGPPGRRHVERWPCSPSQSSRKPRLGSRIHGVRYWRCKRGWAPKNLALTTTCCRAAAALYREVNCCRSRSVAGQHMRYCDPAARNAPPPPPLHSSARYSARGESPLPA